MVIRGWWSWAGATITMGVVMAVVRNGGGGGSVLALPLQQEEGSSPSEQESIESLPMILRYELPKRNAFRSWGGKRSVFGSGDGLPIALRRAYLALFQTARPKTPSTDVELKRASFSPWGGKRSDPSLSGSNIARMSFRPWGGKRSQSFVLDPEEADTEKFLPFMPFSQTEGFQGTPDGINEGYDSHWEDTQLKNGDLYDYYLTDYMPAVSPHKPLRYKREISVSNNNEILQTEPFETEAPENESHESTSVRTKRTKFSAWAGKRLDIDAIREHLRRRITKTPKVPERRAFSAWAGKRSVHPDLPDIEEKRAFSAWAGKRSENPVQYDKILDSNKGKDSNNLTASFDFNLNDRSSDEEGTTQQETGHESNADKDMLEKRATQNLVDEVTYDDPDKRQSFSAWAGKRDDPEKRQSFSAWAGKRQSFGTWASTRNNDNEKRQAFNAWAGKRNDNLDLEKRPSFSAWAGNRDDDLQKRQSFSAWAGKRTDNPDKRQAFNAWAGKRSGDFDKRQSFSAWAGKRSSEPEKRQSFSAWAGKRDDDLDKRQAFNAWAGKRSDTFEKRQKFNAWAGKRSDEMEKRPSFSAWAGKRKFSAWAGKRSDDFDKRQSFNAWAGKRAGEPGKLIIFADPGNKNSEDEKRQSFSAWAGKRSDENLNNDDERHNTLTALQNFNRQIYGVPLSSDTLPLHKWRATPTSFNTWEGNRAELMSRDHNLTGLVLPQL